MSVPSFGPIGFLRVTPAEVSSSFVRATGTTYHRKLRDRFADVFNVKDFGAVGNGAADDSPAIQAALDAAYENSITPVSVYFPAGIYLVLSALTHTQNGNYVRLVGEGMHQTYIRAGASMSYILKMGLSGNGFDGRNTVEGITFDQASLATYGIDATEIAYSTITRNEFTRPPAGGAGLKIGKWMNRVDNNLFHGNSVGDGIHLAGIPFNNLLIERNSFTSGFIAIKGRSGIQDLHIQRNNFDVWLGSSIWLPGGSMNCSIVDNYFEGQPTTGVSVETSSGVFSTRKAPIVCNELYNAPSDTLHENLTIERNTFANVGPISVVDLSNIVGASIRRNHIYAGYSYTNFVNLSGLGSPYTAGKCNIIEYQSTGATVTKPVGLNGNDRAQNHAALQIILNDRTQYARFPHFGGEVLGNPFNWSRFGTVGSDLSIGRDGFFEDIYKVWKVLKPSGSDYYIHKTFTVNSTGSISSFSGPRYFRIQYATRGDVGASNGLQCNVYVGGVLQTKSERQSETWRACENLLVEIPAGTTSFQIVFTPFLSTVPCWVSKLSITDASVPFGQETILTDLDWLVDSAPTYGSYVRGDRFYYKSPAAGGKIGTVCTTTGTPGTFKDFGAIDA